MIQRSRFFCLHSLIVLYVQAFCLIRPHDHNLNKSRYWVSYGNYHIVPVQITQIYISKYLCSISLTCYVVIIPRSERERVQCDMKFTGRSVHFKGSKSAKVTYIQQKLTQETTHEHEQNAGYSLYGQYRLFAVDIVCGTIHCCRHCISSFVLCILISTGLT